MGVRELERAILSELRQVAKDNSLRLKDMMEWSTGEMELHEGETLYRLPALGVNVSVKKVKA